MSKPTRLLVICLGAVLVTAALVAHFSADKATTWRRAAQADQASAAIADAQWRLGLQVREHARHWRAMDASAEAALPVNEDQAAFVGDVEATSARCSTSWSSTSWSAAPISTSGEQAWTVAVAVTGRVSNVMCTVTGLGHMARAVEVTNVSLAYEPGGLVQAQVSLDVYSLASASTGAPIS